MARLIYLDTNFVIRFVESEDSSLLRVLEGTGAGLFELFTSEFTVAEVLVGPLKSGDQTLATYYEELLTTDDFLQVVPIDRVILRETARIRAQYGTRTPDAIHCATALGAGCSVFLSSDARLRMPPGLVRVALENIDSEL
ncbi:MAG: PIN domain-containing protein [Bauldia sp.]